MIRGWYLIISGIILLCYSIYNKILFYRNFKNNTAKNIINDNENVERIQNEKRRYRQLRNIIKDLEDQVRKVDLDIEKSEQKLLGEINKLEDKLKEKKMKTDFKNILQNKYDKDITSEDKEQLSEQYKNVCSLYEKGRAPIEIARELDLGIRETNMIIKFYKKGQVKDVKKSL